MLTLLLQIVIYFMIYLLNPRTPYAVVLHIGSWSTINDVINNDSNDKSTFLIVFDVHNNT